MSGLIALKVKSKCKTLLLKTLIHLIKLLKISTDHAAGFLYKELYAQDKLLLKSLY